jgi:deoxyribodipyrimidine photolyase
MTAISSDHINFAKASLNFMQQALAENGSELLAVMAEARRQAKNAVSPQTRRAAREQLVNLQGQMDAYNAAIQLAADVSTSIESFEGETLEAVCGVVEDQEDFGAVEEEDSGVIVSPRG